MGAMPPLHADALHSGFATAEDALALVLPFAASESACWWPTMQALAPASTPHLRALLKGMGVVARDAGPATSLSPPHERLLARELGWLDTVEGSKNFRDTIHGVRIDTLIVGDFPGDGLPKPVSFPEPESVAETGLDGIPYVTLDTLLELKLASGMTAAHRPQDLADVIELIRVNRLPIEHGERLNPYVVEKFRELWRAAQIVDEY
jgi:hypothetical protein